MTDPIEPQFHTMMNDLAAELDEAFNGKALPGLPRTRKIGFALLAFNFGDYSGGRVNYISNAGREDMIAAMKEWIARAEGRYTDGPERAQ